MSKSTALQFAPRERGVLKITGADRVDLLHRLSTQDLRPLKMPGNVSQTLFTTAQGKAVAWAELMSEAEAVWLICPLPRVARLMQWIDTYTIMEDVCITDATDDYVYVEAYGATAAEALGLSVAPAPGRWQPCATGMQAPGRMTALLPTLGAGVCGLVPKTAWPQMQAQLTDAGATQADARALEQYRLLAGIPSNEHELSGEPNPLEMRLGQSCISWKKGCYIGQEVISRLDSYDKVARLLMGFECAAPLPTAGEQGHKLMIDGRPVGRITSSVPTEHGCIGLALVKRTAAVPAQVQLQENPAFAPIHLVDRPFWAVTP